MWASAADSMSMATAVGNAARIRSTRLASMNASPESTVPVSTRRSTAASTAASCSTCSASYTSGMPGTWPSSYPKARASAPE